MQNKNGARDIPPLAAFFRSPAWYATLVGLASMPPSSPLPRVDVNVG